MADIFTGGCQCGAVRFRVTGVREVAICHCRMCQKAFGSYFAPLVMVTTLDWTRGEPSFFRSSNQARRGFCTQCGTPLCYLGDDGSKEMAAGAFDEPAFADPEVQINVRAKLTLYDRLPDVPHTRNIESEAAFNAKVVSFQHPDHDTAVWPPKGGAYHG
jgi:hypothetical protein